MEGQEVARGSGILLAVSSLPSEYGIGTLGDAAFHFVDLLVDLKQKYWQVLPVGPTSFGDSPYQSLSAFAGNPYLIDLDQLVREKLLTPEEIHAEAARLLQELRAPDTPNSPHGTHYMARVSPDFLARAGTQAHDQLMALLPVSEVWGIGRRIGKKLEAMGIGTVLQLAESDIRFIRKHFTVVLERTVRELRGEPCLALEEFAPAKQEIICSRSFGDRITAYEDMRQAICSYAARAAEKLRGEHQYCRFVSAFVKTSPFALNEPYYGNSASLKLLTPTQDSRDIIAAATSCLDAIWKAGHRYQKAGVMLGDFYSQGVAQLNLFDELAPRHNSARLMQVLDQLNAKNGRGALYFAGQGIQQQWQMKREMLSPRYTTRYGDLLRVR